MLMSVDDLRVLEELSTLEVEEMLLRGEALAQKCSLQNKSIALAVVDICLGRKSGMFTEEYMRMAQAVIDWGKAGVRSYPVAEIATGSYNQSVPFKMVRFFL
ncbi:MAG: hypothetical protein HY225_04040 [Candidatus Vogelbacteria bacterium]|nr:hypothetical protein [Candidatus Vogelbacteria bacterium]